MTPLPPPARRRIQAAVRVWQRGQSMTEYVVVCASLALALGVGMANEDSVLLQLLEAFRTAYRHTSYAMSLPI